MLKLAEIKQIIVEQREIFLFTDQAIERDLLSSQRFADICRLREAVLITGVRRCGKSYTLKLIWQKIKRELAAPSDNFLYVNFESEKMLGFEPKNFDMLLEAHLELCAPERERPTYLFFDEIQTVAGWEKFINRLQEDNRYKIFITGSNASLLSKATSQALTGRSFPVRLHPLSFKEFCRHRLGQERAAPGWEQREQRIAIKKSFREYLAIGGFPEVVKTGFRPLLEEYLRNIIYRDIVLAHRIKYEASLREIVAFITANVGAPLSLEKISRLTRVKNIMTVKNYLSYLTDSFLFGSVHQHSWSVKQQIYNPDKMYLCDVGLYAEMSLAPGENSGRALENAVYNELARRGHEVYYFSAGHECDFILGDKRRVTGAVQACFRLTAENREREIGGLALAMEKYDLAEGLILTEDEEDELSVGGKNISVLPAYKWLLKNGC